VALGGLSIYARVLCRPMCKKKTKIKIELGILFFCFFIFQMPGCIVCEKFQNETLTCLKCNLVTYCSLKCQLKDQDHHQVVCTTWSSQISKNADFLEEQRLLKTVIFALEHHETNNLVEILHNLVKKWFEQKESGISIEWIIPEEEKISLQLLKDLWEVMLVLDDGISELESGEKWKCYYPKPENFNAMVTVTRLSGNAYSDIALKDMKNNQFVYLNVKKKKENPYYPVVYIPKSLNQSLNLGSLMEVLCDYSISQEVN
jgi:hypothetical protein